MAAPITESKKFKNVEKDKVRIIVHCKYEFENQKDSDEWKELVLKRFEPIFKNVVILCAYDTDIHIIKD